VFFTCFAGLQPLRSQVSLPPSPAGQVMTSFLSAFNSADPHQLDEYVRRYDGTATVDELLAFSGSAGGFAVLSVRSSAPDHLKVILKGRSDGVTSFADLRLASTNPEKVKNLIIRALPSGVPVEDIPLTSAIRQQTLQLLEDELSADYIGPKIALRWRRSFGRRKVPELTKP